MAPEDRKQLRRSQFVYGLNTDGQYLLFHTLTKKLIVIPQNVNDYACGKQNFPATVLKQKIWKELYEDYFMVPEDASESQMYLEIKKILVLQEELPKGITQYVILPTTTCNARCFYCFEQGMAYRKMSLETVEDTIRFILVHKPKEGKQINIHWFGGEPMCATDHIDRICDGLKDAGIEYTAEMTSNGSLFTKEAVKKAIEKWNIRKIQITLDGLSEEYARRKRYSEGIKNPFETVIRNVHLMITAGIQVTIRLNTDEDNAEEIFRTADYLKEEFNEEERRRMWIYANPLYGQKGEGLYNCPVATTTDALEAKVTEINEYLLRQGITSFELGNLLEFRTHYCMVTTPDSTGRLYACEGMPESMQYGNVKTGIDPDAWRRVTTPCDIRPECEKCVFLPLCTEFDRCPNRLGWNDCFRREKRKLENQLRIAWEIIRDGQKEADHVSD